MCIATEGCQKVLHENLVVPLGYFRSALDLNTRSEKEKNIHLIWEEQEPYKKEEVSDVP